MSGVAWAKGISATAVISQYNLVTAGNVSTTNDVEGNAVIGGNLAGGTFFNNRAPANPVVDLYGTQSGTTTLDGGSLYYGALTGSVNLNAGATEHQGGWPYALSDFTQGLNAYSQQLAATTAQAGNSAILNGNVLSFNANQADSNGVATFALTTNELTSDFTGAANVTFNLGTGVKTIIVNVTGASFVEPSGANINGAQQDVLFNFVNATQLTLNSWETSVLAPGAALTTSNAIEGFVYASTLLAGGEVHNLGINTILPTATGAPEPATWGLLVVGVTGIAFVRRRSKRISP